tara:strand:+ start:719 stop:1099 length:381 start_codon:yes stop_codon:yes gene_type:complete
MTSSYPTDDKHNRIRGVIDNIIGTEDPDDLMLELMDAISDTEVSAPEAGRYYAFVYNPKTPNIQYDAHPLVAVTDILEWGFKGFNYHWGQMRQYTWQEVVGRVYEIYPEELSDAQEIPFQKIRLNS